MRLQQSGAITQWAHQRQRWYAVRGRGSVWLAAVSALRQRSRTQLRRVHKVKTSEENLLVRLRRSIHVLCVNILFNIVV